MKENEVKEIIKEKKEGRKKGRKEYLKRRNEEEGIKEGE